MSDERPGGPWEPTHTLKTAAKYYEDVHTDRKTFEVRSEVDRHFFVGDYLVLYEIDEDHVPTGRWVHAQISYVLRGPWPGDQDIPTAVASGYVVLGFRILSRRNTKDGNIETAPGAGR